MLKNKMEKLINYRTALDLECDEELMKCWEEEILSLSNNISETKNFYKNECSDEILFWTSEVFEELIEVTQSIELLDILRDLSLIHI